ncbi:TonB family protein [Sulfitobacter sp. THAF37]|uniref:cell envelope integrity protein TolA n=1 Tax=Sulfitobacter sp. THAF37 TaxID=2587855 RepID=UPI0015624235|nr:TonB family protein [Sulfitobacter sp. THAF37]
MTLAVTLITGGALLVRPDPNIESAGGGAPVEARMGTAFEDMSVGTLTAQSTADTTPPPETARSARRTPPQVMPPAPPPAETARVTPAATPSLQANVVAQEQVERAERPLTPSTALSPTEPQDTISSVAPDTTAPPRSVRPQRRDPEQAEKVAAARPKTTKTRQPAPQETRGNAQRKATRGTATANTREAKARSQGNTRQATAQSGNAAASNYPGKVMRKISRMRRPDVRARGSATIAFRVSSSGGLAGISVARSSGSAALDRAALRMVQAAAPFPRPPAGAGRSFSIRIQGQ